MYLKGSQFSHPQNLAPANLKLQVVVDVLVLTLLKPFNPVPPVPPVFAEERNAHVAALDLVVVVVVVVVELGIRSRQPRHCHLQSIERPESPASFG